MNSANAPGRPKRPKFSTSRRGSEKGQVEAYSDEMSVSEDDVSEDAEPEATTDDESNYGESRYARKSSHLPRIKSDTDAPSTGAGLRSAIIGAHSKRGGGSA